MQVRRAPLLLIPPVLMLSLGAPTQGEVSTVTAGELKVENRAIPLRHAATLALDDAEGLRSKTAPKRTMVVLLSESKVTARVMGNPARCGALAVAGQLAGVEIRIDPGKRTLLSSLVFARPHERLSAAAHLPTDQEPDNCELRNLRIANGWISGTVLMKRAEPWPDPAYRVVSPPQFQFHVEFRAPVQEQPAVTAVLNGSAARSSPQARAFAAMGAALRKGDVATARRSVTPEVRASWNHLIARWGAGKFKELMANRPDADAHNRQIHRVVIRGSEARIVFLEPVRRAENAVLRDGKWLIDTP